MVYDLGGGTFDVSILEIGDGVIDVLATAGNNRLGGDDFDKCITDYMVQEFKKTEGIDLSSDKAVSYTHLDVYKRQARRQEKNRGCRRCGRRQYQLAVFCQWEHLFQQRIFSFTCILPLPACPSQFSYCKICTVIIKYKA